MKLLGVLAFLTVMLLIPWRTLEPTVNQVMNLVPVCFGVAAVLGVPLVFIQGIVNGFREQQAAKATRSTTASAPALD